MGSRFSDDFADSACIDLLSEHGEEIAHYPGGSGTGATVTAIVTLEDPSVRHESGRDVLYVSRLEIDESVQTSPSDLWLIDGWKYTTVKIGNSMFGLRS